MANITYESETLYPHTPLKFRKIIHVYWLWAKIMALCYSFQRDDRLVHVYSGVLPAQRPSVNFYWKEVVTVGEFERWLCHIWPVDMMKFASLEANLGGGWDLLVSFLSPSFLEEPQTWLEYNWLGLFKSLSQSTWNPHAFPDSLSSRITN